MPLSDFRHRLPLRVRWAEIDAQGVVFNGHYLTYCNACVMEYWRAIGLTYPADFFALGSDLLARKATVDYLAAAVYGDELLLCGRTARLGRSSLSFMVEIFRAGALQDGADAALTQAELVYVSVDPQARKSKPWPEQFRTKVLAFERVAPVTPDAS